MKVSRVEAGDSRVMIGTNALITARPEVVIAIGISKTRRENHRFRSAGFTAATWARPSATRCRDARNGKGSIICAGLRGTTNLTAGRRIYLNINTTLGHPCALDDNAAANPLAPTSGAVTIGMKTMVGRHSAILSNLTPSARWVAGASSCLVKDAHSDTVAKRVPAR